MMRYDFTIIGAGVSGMTAALLLARHGRKVALIEKSNLPAPTIRGFFRQGVYFDTGLHYTGSFAPGEMLDVYFRALGLEGIERQPFNPDCFDLLRYADRAVEIPLPVGYDRIHDRLCSLFPRESRAIRICLDDIRSDFESSPFLNLNLDTDAERSATDVQTSTLAEYLDALTDDPLLKSILTMHGLLYGVSPRETSFTAHAKVAGSYYQSVHGIRGGGLSIVRSFETAMRASGVECHYGSGAKRVLLTPAGRIRAVVLENNDILETEGVICTTHPGALLDLVPEDALRPIYRRRVKELADTPSAYILYGIAEEPVELLRGSNLLVSPDSRPHGWFSPARRPEEGPWYVTASQSGQGAQGVVVITPGHIDDFVSWEGSSPGNRPKSYREFKRDRLDDMRTALLKHAPELEAVRFIDGATPLTFRDYLHTPSGSLYGVRHSVNQYNPSPATRIPGLLLAGQSIIAPGLLGAVVSAFITCGFVIGHAALREELKTCA